MYWLGFCFSRSKTLPNPYIRIFLPLPQMTITDYLQRFKEWRQRLCMDRLILLVLVVTNALLIAHCLSRKPTVELLLPFMETQAGVHSGEASVTMNGGGCRWLNCWAI